LEIIKAKNGFIVKTTESFVVFEQVNEVENMAKLLYFVKDYFGVTYSKHKSNIIIEVKSNE
jgi:hypothetical protein